jgi:hypothetical protein
MMTGGPLLNREDKEKICLHSTSNIEPLTYFPSKEIPSLLLYNQA